MIKLLAKYFRLKMKYQVEAERYAVLRNSSATVWHGEELRGVELDRKIDEQAVKMLQVQIEGLNKCLSETNGYDSAITYIKQRAKLELKVIEIEERWG